MQDIVNLKVSDLESLDLNFTPLVPFNSQDRYIQYRPEDEKWSSILFRDIQNHHEFRVKEFFLDWFCPGYPKSLMSSFADTYSNLFVRSLNNTVYFYGKNYRGRDSVTFYTSGTTVEIESENPCTPEDILEYSYSLIPATVNRHSLSHKDFYQRSFHTRNRDGGWFEDRRISRLSWQGLSDMITLEQNMFIGSGVGILKEPSNQHFICVYEDSIKNRALWIEYLRDGSSLEHGSYLLRGGRYLYTDYNLAENDSKWAFRRGTGPYTFQLKMLGGTVTIMISPGVTLCETPLESIGKIMQPHMENALTLLK